MLYEVITVRLGTVIGIVMMLVVAGLQMALVFGLMPFERQVLWVNKLRRGSQVQCAIGSTGFRCRVSGVGKASQ